MTMQSLLLTCIPKLYMSGVQKIISCHLHGACGHPIRATVLLMIGNETMSHPQLEKGNGAVHPQKAQLLGFLQQDIFIDVVHFPENRAFKIFNDRLRKNITNKKNHCPQRT